MQKQALVSVVFALLVAISTSTQVVAQSKIFESLTG